MGIHWGTFELADEALDQPPKDLAASKARRGLADSDFFLLKVGETRAIPLRQRASSGGARGLSVSQTP